ncbi:MAG: DinB family protein [Syntrophales bacterium]|nr:DinB family protein [Syntrophales bacterium]MDY0045346.1 hypothetical protein [Syntrophales bacterium]
MELINAKTILTPYSVWHLVEHIRIAQWDILEFIRDPLHISPEYPAGYRPDAYAKAEEHMWKDSVLRVKSDLASLIKIAVDEKNDLFAPIAHAPEYTIFRELLVVADHNAYHTGEIALLRQELNAWPKDHPYLTGQG